MYAVKALLSHVKVKIIISDTLDLQPVAALTLSVMDVMSSLQCKYLRMLVTCCANQNV